LEARTILFDPLQEAISGLAPTKKHRRRAQRTRRQSGLKVAAAPNFHPAAIKRRVSGGIGGDEDHLLAVARTL
jgi:hypothetical protein